MAHFNDKLESLCYCLLVGTSFLLYAGQNLELDDKKRS